MKITDTLKEVSQTQPEINCSIGIMAYNEEENIGQLLTALLAQQSTRTTVKEMIVLASGCTDNTEAIARDFASRHPQIKVLTQARREGKSAAVNLFLRHAESDILVLESADTLPDPETIERLLEPFTDLTVGMTGGHPIPVNDPRTFMGFAVHLL